MADYATKKGRSSKHKDKLKQSLNGSTFTALRHDVINSPEYLALSLSAKSVFIHLLAKYNRINNGDISAPQNRAKEEFNLSSRGLKKALEELINANFIEVTRQGGKNQCSLYAITCYPLNNIVKTGLVQAETHKPSDKWRKL